MATFIYGGNLRNAHWENMLLQQIVTKKLVFQN